MVQNVKIEFKIIYVFNLKTYSMKKFFNLDLHISVIADIKHILKTLYPEDIEVTDWSLSGHTWVFGKNPTPVDVVNQWTWQSLNDAMIDMFIDRYHNELCKYDGFIVTHGLLFIRLFERFNKPIIMINSCRFDMPYCWTNNLLERSKLIECLQRLYTKNLLIPIANNKADRDYFAMATGIIPQHIPSLCLYPGFQWNETSSLNFPLVCYNNHEISSTLHGYDKKPDGFTWEWLYTRHRGIIHIPYEVSTMSTFEHYSSGIPLFFPTKEFYKHLIQTKKASVASYNGTYWKSDSLPTDLKPTNDLDWWLDRADFYDPENMAYIHFYSSWEELQQFIDIPPRDDPKKTLFLEQRKMTILSQWKKIIDSNFF
jgi:hypothetical protein